MPSADTVKPRAASILATSARAFLVVKFAGAGYLAYLGIHMLLEGSRTAGAFTDVAPEPGWRIYRAGVLTNVLNPKVALFFMAFLPQFVDAGAPSKISAFLFLGGLFMFTGTAWSFVLVWCASAMSRRFRENPSAGVLKRAAGAMFIGLGVKLAVGK